ncbi:MULTISPECIES: VOC family protein [Ferrimonas]|uniref:VOC family protein n=1 Tax=Ferrimonas TaxID=44011 RepID=UPI0003FBAAD2|nr:MULTISPECIES: VOC family protein [Ferrimonas]USD39185.1 VOC family protein [Ferrimonas sp. SCSIO 43195]
MAETINYIEFASADLDASKGFFEAAFGWPFQDYGPDYSAFTTPELSGGLFYNPKVATTADGAPLLVLHSSDLGASLDRVRAAGGRIVKPIFEFPGGRRFHFVEPGGNELAIWSES